MRRTAAGLLVILALVACSSPAPSETAAPPTASPTASPSPSLRPVTMADLAHCPVTKPTAAPTDIDGSLFGSATSYGNDSLWVGALGDGGVIAADNRFINADGSVGWKLGWWREISGDLTITGQRLDAQAAPLESDVPSGYGPTGFQASGVTFPTEGCWRITGHVGTASLTFVTFVIKVGPLPTISPS